MGKDVGQWENPPPTTLSAWLSLAVSSCKGQSSVTPECPQPVAQQGTWGQPLTSPTAGVTQTHSVRISFHSSSETPICFPVFLVSLGSPSPATST